MVEKRIRLPELTKSNQGTRKGLNFDQMYEELSKPIKIRGSIALVKPDRRPFNITQPYLK